VKDPDERLAWALDVCRKLGMRLTPGRRKILAVLAAHRAPVSLETVMQTGGVRQVCDATTAYRTLMLFRDAELVRQVALPAKVRFFVLNVPGESIHFLICRRCGAITELDPEAHCEAMESAVAAAHGYTELHHEQQFFGICPACQKLPPRVPSAKLPVRISPRHQSINSINQAARPLAA
jgi:Fe2+ or Zn2+ uptake regulation protein